MRNPSAESTAAEPWRAGSRGHAIRQPATVRKQQIADAALEIIAARGLRHFTAKEIGRSLGITDAAVFRHLPSKQAIVRASIDRVEQLLFQGFPPTDDDPIARLGIFFRQRARIVANRPGIARLMFSEDLAYAGEPEDDDRVQAFKKRSADFVRCCLEEARARGMLVPGVKTREASLVVMGALMAFLFARHGPAIALNTGRGGEGLWKTLEAMLCRERGSESGEQRRERRKEKMV